MRRTLYNVTGVNSPKTIAGLEYKLVVAIFMFFGSAALMFRSPELLILPIVVLMFLRGPGVKDPLFIQIYIKHKAQRDLYSPAYITKPNQRWLRPQGFGRRNWF